MSHIYTSDEILGMEDLYNIQEDVCSHGLSIRYRLTEAELGWLDFVRGRYAIADYFLGALEYVDPPEESDELDAWPVVTIDMTGLVQALEDDCPGAGKAVCLSDETALQKLCFWLWQEPQE